MEKRIACLMLTLATTACVSGPDQRTPLSPALTPTASVPIEVQIAELERSSQPGTSHKEFLALCGDWNVRLVDISADGRETQVALGTAVIRPEFGGRFLCWKTTMQFGARVHATTGFLGYDLGNREYQSMMINDVGTGMSVAHGTGQLKRSGIRFTLEVVDRDSGGRARMSSLLRMIDADHFVQDLLGGDPQGSERSVRSYHYAREMSPPAATTK